jgi:hypothetical protein
MQMLANRPHRTVAAFDTYPEAQRAVDRLSDAGFPVERVAIVGHGLRSVERVTGRVSTGRAALIGASQGVLLGALFGLLVGLAWGPEATLLLMLYGIVAGGLFGALMGAVTHAATRGERDFASVAGLEAERYEVVVDDEFADRAAELLQTRASGTG